MFNANSKKHQSDVNKRCSGVLIVNFEHISDFFYSVSIVEFEQVSVVWAS